MRVDRGRSWLYPAWLLRSATREWNPADFRGPYHGVPGGQDSAVAQ